MRRGVRTVMALSAAIAFAAPAMAAEAPPTVTVAGAARIAATPDRVTLEAAVETRAKGAAEALAANADRMAGVVEALRAAGVPEEDIATVELTLDPVEGRDETGRPSGRIDHYRAGNGVRVTTGDLAGVGRLVDTLVGAGANRIGRIAFTLSDRSAVAAEARRAAMADARRAAETLAEAEGLALGAVVEIAAADGGGPVPRLRGAAMETAVSTPVMPGQIGVSASVEVTWTLRAAE